MRYLTSGILTMPLPMRPARLSMNELLRDIGLPATHCRVEPGAIVGLRRGSQRCIERGIFGL
jgi:hypothetical protein